MDLSATPVQHLLGPGSPVIMMSEQFSSKEFSAAILLLHSNGLLGHSAPFLILSAIEFGKRGWIIRRGRNGVASEHTACIGFLQALDDGRVDLSDDLGGNARWPGESKPDVGCEIWKALFRKRRDLGISREPIGCRNSECMRLPTKNRPGGGRESGGGYRDVSSREICHGF